MKFTELDLVEELQQNLQAIGFTECTPVQEQVLPVALTGKDISALSQTGTGKTAAFLLPMMDRILRSLKSPEAASEGTTEISAEPSDRSFTGWKKGHFVLVLVPTRELAEQVYQDVYKLRGTSGLEAASIYGGTEYEEQKRKLAQGVQFVIGTPGRLIDLYKTHSLDLRQVRAVIFDEADRMFDMGFKEDMKFMLQRIPKERQMMMFSATMNFDVLETAYRFGSDPVEFNLSRDQVKAENVKDEIFHVGEDEKPRVLLSLIKKYNPKQVIIFSNFKNNVERISNFLTKNEIPALGISSLLTQAQRNRVITMFKEGTGQNILVATDVAARGLDIKNVDLVINMELPDDAENYVHRIGRTGRAGAEGKAFSLVSDRDVDALGRIQDYLKHKLEVGWLEETEFVNDFKPIGGNEERKPKWEDRPKRPQGAGGGRPERRPRHDKRDGRRPEGRPERQEGRPDNRPDNRPDRLQGARPPRPGGHPQKDRPHRQDRPAGGGPGKHPPRQVHTANGKSHTKHRPQHGKNRPYDPNFKRRPLKTGKSEGVLTKVGKFFKNLFGAE